MFKIFLFVLALILSGTATFLTASGMALLFSGLWFLFITIDIGRFFVTDYLIKGWKKISGIKYFTTIILGLLLCLSSVGVYNSLDQRIPKSMHDSIVEAASYNKNAKNSETTQDISKMSYEIALTEYNTQVSAYGVQKDACLNKEGADQEKCIRTYNANLNNAKNKLDSAKKEYTNSINSSTQATTDEYKNKTEIAGILTTICQFTGGGCDSTQGLTRALRIIILLIILGLEIFAINILFIIHSKEEQEPQEKKEMKLPKIEIKKYFKKKEKKVKEVPVVEEKKEIELIEPIETVKENVVVEKPVIKEETVKEVVKEPIIVKAVKTESTEEKIAQIQDFLDSKLISSNKEYRDNSKTLTFDEAIKILEEEPDLLNNIKIKGILRAHPSLKRIIEKKLKK